MNAGVVSSTRLLWLWVRPFQNSGPQREQYDSWVRTHEMTQPPGAEIMSRILILLSIFTFIITDGSLAQSSNQEPTIGELQRQVQEIRSQMIKMQNRIESLCRN